MSGGKNECFRKNFPCHPTASPLTELQKTVEEKITKPTIQVVKDILMTLMTYRSYEPRDFVQSQITPRQAPLLELDERTNKFFHKMMEAINIQLNKIPLFLNHLEN